MNNERRRALLNIVERLTLIRKEARSIEKAEQKAFSRMSPNLKTKAATRKFEKTDFNIDDATVCIEDAIRIYKKAAK